MANGVSTCLNPKAPEPGRQNFDVQGQEKTGVLAQAESKFSLPPPFCSLQALNVLDEAHLHW